MPTTFVHIRNHCTKLKRKSTFRSEWGVCIKQKHGTVSVFNDPSCQDHD